MAYKSDERLSRSARKFYNAYKKMFDRFSEQNRHNAEVETVGLELTEAQKRYALDAISDTVDKAIANKGDIGEEYNQKRISPVPFDVSQYVSAASGGKIDISAKHIALSGPDLWHEYREHCDSYIETGRNQVAFTPKTMKDALEAIYSPDLIETVFADANNPTQRQSFAYAKKSPDGHYIVVEAVGGKYNPNIVPIMILQFNETKWNDMMNSGITLGEMFFENDPKKENALDIAFNKKNRVIVAQFALPKAIASTPHSPRFNNSIAQPKRIVNRKGVKNQRNALPEDVDSRTYSYDEIVAKGDLTGTIIDDTLQVPIKTDSNGYIKIDSSAVFDTVKAQCEQIKTNAPFPTYYVNVPDIGKNVEITKDSVQHGYHKGVRAKKTNIPSADMLNARVSLKLPEILKKSIEINISERSDNKDIPYSHVMIGTVAIKNADGTIEYYAVRSVIEERVNQDPILAEAKVVGKLHAINAKKVGMSNAQVAKTGVALTDNDAYTCSIAQFLDDVKGKFDDTFSNDVYTRHGVQRKVNPFSANLRHALPEGVDSDNVEPVGKDGKFGPFDAPFTGTISSVTTEKKDVYKRGVKEAAMDIPPSFWVRNWVPI